MNKLVIMIVLGFKLTIFTPVLCINIVLMSDLSFEVAFPSHSPLAKSSLLIIPAEISRKRKQTASSLNEVQLLTSKIGSTEAQRLLRR